MLSWLGAGLTLASVWLVGRHDWRGWVVGLVAQAVWIVFALRVGDGGLLFVEIALGAIVASNLWHWWKERTNG